MAVKQCCCGAKLSPNKKSIFGLWNQILFLAFFVCILVGVTTADTEISCSTVKTLFENKGMLPAADIQEQPNSDAGELCLTRGCCGAGARSRFSQAARTQLETSLRTELSKLADVLANRAKRFDEFFRKLLQQSREDFHSMFKRTYGMIYEQHSYVFEQLFEQLERYYARGDTDLDNMMDNFFGILYQKMFTVLNSQYSFDEKYLKCVSEHMRDTQPFEDVPHKLSVQLRRAFVATRTFHKALRAGAELVRNMQQVGVTQDCVTSWARLKYCGSCSDARPPPCSRYCHNVLRGCLPAHADLAQQWDAYVDAVEKVADRLLGPFNIVMVVVPIDIKISEAIMNFQEHNQEISQKIFAGCGKPVLGGGAVSGPFFSPDRSRRSVRSVPDVEWTGKDEGDDFEIEASFESLIKEDPMLSSLRSKGEIEETIKKMSEQAEDREKFLQYLRGDLDAEEFEEHERKRRDAEPAPASAEIDYRAFEFEGKKKKKKPAASSKENGRDVSEWGGPALERLVRETRARVRASRRYWANLPYLLCSEPGAAAPPAPNKPCFNGTHAASYTLTAAGEGSAALASNPEVRGVVGGTSIVTSQQEALKTLTARLKDAYNGVEVQWRDADDLQTSAQSLDSVAVDLGSGSGSGDDSDDTGDDDDRDANVDYPASGQGPPEDDEAEVPDNREPETRPEPNPPASEVPFTPYEVPNTRVIDDTVDIDNIDNAIDVKTDAPQTDSPVREKPMTGSAERPSLQKALLTYALPVVCAWFGTIVTEWI